MVDSLTSKLPIPALAETVNITRIWVVYGWGSITVLGEVIQEPISPLSAPHDVWLFSSGLQSLTDFITIST